MREATAWAHKKEQHTGTAQTSQMIYFNKTPHSYSKKLRKGKIQKIKTGRHKELKPDLSSPENNRFRTGWMITDSWLIQLLRDYDQDLFQQSFLCPSSGFSHHRYIPPASLRLCYFVGHTNWFTYSFFPTAISDSNQLYSAIFETASAINFVATFERGFYS